MSSRVCKNCIHYEDEMCLIDESLVDPEHSCEFHSGRLDAKARKFERRKERRDKEFRKLAG